MTRLDRNTSGLVVFAKFGHVHHLFSKVKFKKEYVALAYGHTQSSGVIEAPIARRSDSIIKREVNDKGSMQKQSIKGLCKMRLLVYVRLNCLLEERIKFEFTLSILDIH